MLFARLKAWWSRRLGAGGWLSRFRPGLRTGASEAARADQELVFGLAHSRIPTRSQLRYLGTILQVPERRIVRWLGTIAIIAGLVLIGSFLNRHVAFVARAGGTLTEGVIGVPQFLNPILARPQTADAELVSLAFRGLMRMNEQFELVPDLAEQIEVSPDGRTYTIRLRKHLRWSDGQPLTSKDVVYTFETMADPLYKSPYLAIFQNVTVAALDDQTITFTLPEPLAPFLSYLIIGLLPEHAWLDAAPAAFALAELNLKPISNGPFQFHSLTKDRDGNIKSMQFIRNTHFHGSAPYLDKIVIKFYPEYASALDALKSSAVDALGNIHYEDASEAERAGEISKLAVAQLTAVFINQKTNGALKAKETRIALSHATDRAAIVSEALDGNGQPIVGPILPGYLGYNPHLKRYDFNLETANKILEDAGWKRTESGVRQKGAQQLTFVFTIVDQPTQVAVAERLVEDWRKIGANIEIQKIDPTRFQKDVLRPRQYEALLFGQIFSTDPDPYPFWHSSQQRETGFNLSIFFSKKIDQDLEHGRTTTSNDERATDYFDFQNVLAEEVPAIFLYQNLYLYAHPRSLRGMTVERIVIGADRYQYSESWYMRTRPAWVAADSQSERK